MTNSPVPAPPLVLAVEGLCFAGKTTLARALARRLDAPVVAEYGDLAGLPPFPPRDIAAARAALSLLLAAEAGRSRQARASGSRLVVYDRSPLSVIGHEHAMRARGVPADPETAAAWFTAAARTGAILTPAACEGTSTLFPVDYFGEPAFLTQSGQLYIESTALALGKVYSFGPTFRAEKSKTRRHLTEFWMIEPEVAYCDLDGLLELAENFLSHIVQSVLKNRGPELVVIGRDRAKLEAIIPPFPRLRYDEAADMLNQAHKDGHLEAPFEYGNDFGSPDETWLSSQFDRPVMVNRYPADVKAFYMEPDPKDPRYALCVDVLAPEGYGEIIGGSQRVSSYELLSSRIDQHKLPREAFEWYLDLRRYGSVPHSGFGMGIERAVAWICGLDHVRETIPFARTLHRIYP